MMIINKKRREKGTRAVRFINICKKDDFFAELY